MESRTRKYIIIYRRGGKKMTDNEIIKYMQCVIGNEVSCSECTYQKVLPFPSCRMMCAKNALDLINRQKARIKELEERCNKND